MTDSHDEMYSFPIKLFGFHKIFRNRESLRPFMSTSFMSPYKSYVMIDTRKQTLSLKGITICTQSKERLSIAHQAVTPSFSNTELGYKATNILLYFNTGVHHQSSI